MPAIATTYPPCPDCGHPTQLIRDVEETTRGVPRTWWCPACTTHLRRQGDVWEVMDLDAEGRLLRRATAWAGAHWLRTMQALCADDRLHATARVVGMSMLTRTDDQGRAVASLHQIGGWAGCSWQRAWHGCRELEAAGWMTWHGRRFRGGYYQMRATSPISQ